MENNIIKFETQNATYSYDINANNLNVIKECVWYQYIYNIKLPALINKIIRLMARKK